MNPWMPLQAANLFGSIFVAQIIVQNQRTRSKFELDLYFLIKYLYMYFQYKECANWIFNLNWNQFEIHNFNFIYTSFQNLERKN